MSYERLEVFKETNKSKVYLVYDSEHHRMAVEKHLHGEIKVYKLLKDLHHHYLPIIYEVQFQNGETIVHEEYIPGSSLAHLMVTEKQLIRWLLELCDVLDCLHSHGIHHKDIKPSNLLLGNDGHLRLIDFDAAQEKSDLGSTDRRILGTRGYAPPEQYGFAQTDARADIYALGVTFKKLLGKSADKCCYRYIFKRCTAIDPEKRYPSVKGVQRAIYVERIWRPGLCLTLVLIGILKLIL